ncbi:CBS domain-containing protein [Streptomyces spongiicola]|uniref:CBS domain-containing protein n=1 Tax=Streptomyces spongiicola TaxID=1690221 RepID=A0A2S1Z7A8_9ACTN|nr:CBS domain-containing protein [Streptomyces spongiicola]AWK12249.1 CBS domain-containing protein [Streptomyces spongiicola]GBQ02333.1 CBS domain-containing protein [Streptomyces spongiicola]
MARLVKDVMTTGVLALPPEASLVEAARLMRDMDVGDVLVADSGRLLGVLTDRDIAVRSVAMGHDPHSMPVRSVCTPGVLTVGPHLDAWQAMRIMGEHGVRRLAVVEDGRPVGVVSLGDLERAREPGSVLAGISAAPPNNGA